MGLDMYLKGSKFHTFKAEKTIDGFKVREEVLDLGYWRKHPNLHGYIVSNFADADDCTPVQLSEDNLHAIIAAIKNNELPETHGFFFGESDNSEGQRQEDVAVFEGALEWLEKETDEYWHSVIYQASW